MKIFILIAFLCCLVSTTYAATPVLSLEKQMQRQNIVNKKNTIAEKRMITEAKKRANQQKITTLRIQRIQSTNIPKNTEYPSSIVTQQVSTPIRKEAQQTIIVSTQTYSTPTSQKNIAWVDMSRVRSTWLWWYNSTRSDRWLGIYSYDNALDSTAHDWNTVFAGSRGSNYHERNPGDGYYKYSVIDAWFKARWVNPPIIAWVNHSENVSYGTYSCSDSDCTDELISAIRSSYVFFINSTVHAKSVYQPNFTKIGLDVMVVPSERRYYVTVHYMTR